MPAAFLGIVPPVVNLAWWAAAKLGPTLLAAHRDLPLTDAAVHRIGDLMVWDGPTGRSVLAGLESVGESATRIENAVNGVAASQAALGTSLQVVAGLSLATLGATGLSAAFMAVRFQALMSRLNRIADAVNDVNTKLDYGVVTRDVNAAIMHMRSYEADPSTTRYLTDAEHAATTGLPTLRGLLQTEAAGRRRPEVLNFYGRFLILDLMVLVRSLILQKEPGKLRVAVETLDHQADVIRSYAQALFDFSLGTDPAMYLDPALGSGGVTLDLVAETFRQAAELGIAVPAEAGTTSGAFEFLRAGMYGAKRRWGLFSPVRRTKARLLMRLRYLLAGLEDGNRLLALRLRIQHALTGNYSPADLETEVRKLSPTDLGGGGVYAYAFP